MEYQELLNAIQPQDIADISLIKKAIDFALKYHANQTRASGEPYHKHPIEVAKMIAEMRLDSASIITAILHDTVEDTDLTLEEINKNFGSEITKLVDGVTKLSKIEFMSEHARQAENFRKLLLAMSDDIRVLLVKLVDRLHNMRTIHFIKSPEKRTRIALETMEIYAPLAERIGVQKIKVELQDLCFQVLHPDIHQSIINRFDSIAHDKDHLIDRVIEEIALKVCQEVPTAKIFGRRKTPYSTWMKMKQKNIGIDQLSDIIAFRIIVTNIGECYQALGIVHSNYQVVPDNFQDFISTPKKNGYQSLHTVVIGPLKQKIEIQIRTDSMHEVAELGVAAHWQYKQNHNDLADGKKYAWIRELLSILDHADNPEEFLQNTKLSMYYDQVFCFTPKGNLIALPKGATTLDFAYAVHSDIGNSCVGAKINGRIVPLKTQLTNGDQVEIITSKNHTPPPAWEKIVVTGKARADIRKALRQKQGEQYIKLGAAILQKTFKAASISDENAAITEACNFFHKKNPDDLFYAVGEGSIAREDVLKQVLPRKSKLGSTLSLLKLKKRTQKNQNNEHAIPIKGLVSGVAMHLAKCCHPLIGDKIVGIIHTGRGVTVHVADCDVLGNFSNMPERILDLTWDADQSQIPLISRVKVLLLNESASLGLLTSEIAKEGGNITNFKIINRQADFFEIMVDIEVTSTEHLDTIINSLRTKKLIQHIERYKL